ncbi:hypothetical protein PS726_05404 [Pseudomonas fluorescens]|nr:hypothetical protein PS726_05404 [Pseudomonas fluorescens]
MRAFFVCWNVSVFFRSPSRASPLPQGIAVKCGSGGATIRLAREGASEANRSYRLETRYTRSSSRVTPASRNFPLSLNTS